MTEDTKNLIRASLDDLGTTLAMIVEQIKSEASKENDAI